MTLTLTSAAALSEAERAVLASLISDALAYRWDTSTPCADCEADASLCDDHARDYEMAASYRSLARDHGIAVDQ